MKRSTTQCTGKTQKGERCKNVEGSCRYHKGETPSKTKKRTTPPSKSPEIFKTKVLKVSSPQRKAVDTSPTQKFSSKMVLDKHYRGVSEKLCYDALGWNNCKDADKYHLEYKDEWKDVSPTHYRYGTKPYPKEFKIVADHLMEVCKSILEGFCDVHPTMPGIQWSNVFENNQKAKEEWKDTMLKRGNHYVHNVDFKDNSIKVFGLDQDLPYCMCQETRTASNAFYTLLLDPRSDDIKWQEHHGSIHIDEDTKYPEKYILDKDKFEIKRKVTTELREKIIRDSIDYLGEEFKVHLMPKPEYQIPILRELVKLLAKDKVFNSHVDTWKAIIPYDRIVGEINLPSIVIYPVWGIKSTKIVISKIIEHFSMFDADEIGLDLTPRFNHRHNSLIYWANGSGDHKKLLPESYFTGPDKVFYKNHKINFA